MSEQQTSWFGEGGHGAHLRDLAERRQQWDQQKELEAEQAERDRKMAELEAYLRDRGREWQDTTGSAPSLAVIEKWQTEFMDMKQLEAEAVREAKLAVAEEDF